MREFDDWEREVWLQAWLVVAGAANCRNSDVPGKWADRALAEFRAKFPKSDPPSAQTGKTTPP